MWIIINLANRKRKKNSLRECRMFNKIDQLLKSQIKIIIYLNNSQEY